MSKKQVSCVWKNRGGRTTRSAKVAIGVTLAFALFMTGLSTMNDAPADQYQAQVFQDLGAPPLGGNEVFGLAPGNAPEAPGNESLNASNSSAQSSATDSRPADDSKARIPGGPGPNSTTNGGPVVGSEVGSNPSEVGSGGLVGDEIGAPITCSDSDNGADKYSAGVSQRMRSGQPFEEAKKDFCLIQKSNSDDITYESKYLSERHKATSYYCSGNQVRETTEGCELGCNKAGTACVKKYEVSCVIENFQAIRTVKDADTGEELSKKTTKQFCKDNQLFSFGCGGENKSIVAMPATACEAGCNAEGTACNKASACKDTDPDDDIYTKGEVKIFIGDELKINKTDECRGTYGVTQYSCVAGDIKTVDNLSCPTNTHSCQEGKCVPKAALGNNLDEVNFFCTDHHVANKDYTFETAIVNVIKQSKQKDDQGNPLVEERESVKDKCTQMPSGKWYKMQYGCSNRGKPYVVTTMTCPGACRETDQGAVCERPAEKSKEMEQAQKAKEMEQAQKAKEMEQAQKAKEMEQAQKAKENTAYDIRPDLKIDYLGWGTNGAGKQIRADIKNSGIGPVMAKELKVTFEINGQKELIVTPLQDKFPPNNWMPVLIPVSAFKLDGAKIFTVKATVDHRNEIAETNDNNNESSTELIFPCDAGQAAIKFFPGGEISQSVDFAKRGQVVWGDVTYYDQCASNDPSSVEKYYCDQSGKAVSKKVKCPDNQKCTAGGECKAEVRTATADADKNGVNTWETDPVVKAATEKITNTQATIAGIQKRMDSGLGGVNSCTQMSGQLVLEHERLIAEYEALLEHANKQQGKPEALAAAREIGLKKLPDAREAKAKAVNFCKEKYTPEQEPTKKKPAESDQTPNRDQNQPAPKAGGDPLPADKNLRGAAAQRLWRNDAALLEVKNQVADSLLALVDTVKLRNGQDTVQTCAEVARQEIKAWERLRESLTALRRVTAEKGLQQKAAEIEAFVSTIGAEQKKTEEACSGKFATGANANSTPTNNSAPANNAASNPQNGVGNQAANSSRGGLEERIAAAKQKIARTMPEFERAMAEAKNNIGAEAQCRSAGEKSRRLADQLDNLYAELEQLYNESGKGEDLEKTTKERQGFLRQTADLNSICDQKGPERELTLESGVVIKDLAAAAAAAEQGVQTAESEALKQALAEAKKREAEIEAAKQAAAEAKKAAEAAAQQAKSEADRLKAQQEAARKQREYEEKKLASILEQYEALLKKAKADAANSCAGGNSASGACQTAQSKEREVIVRIITTSAAKEVVEAEKKKETATTKEQQEEYTKQLERARNAQKASFRARGLTNEEKVNIIRTNFPGTDVNAWYSTYLAKAFKYGCFQSGDPRLSDFIKRSEMVKVIVCYREGTDYAKVATQDFPEVFNDVPKGVWYFAPIMKLYSYGVAQGYISANGPYNREFRPEEAANRAETLLLLARSYGFECKFPRSGIFKDVSANDWFAACAGMANDIGVIAGYEDGTFRPSNNINRAEFLKMLNRFDEILLQEFSS